MKELFFKFTPGILLVTGAGTWLIALLFFIKSGSSLLFILFGPGQLLLFLYCGFLIKRLYCQANIDSLTGIYNRRCFFSEMSEIIKKQYHLSLMMIDIDNFKNINDTYGHSVGDEVLRLFAEILINNTRSTDIVARLGGDEFVVAFPQTGRNNALKMAERIKKIIEDNYFSFGFIQVRLTISIGLTTSKPPIEIDDLLVKADKALYQAKNFKNTIKEV